MPLPLNQKTKREGIACAGALLRAGAAYAVPQEFSMMCSGGRPMRTKPPAKPIPRRNPRRAIEFSEAMLVCSFGRSQRTRVEDHQIFPVEPRITERVKPRLDHGRVGGSFAPSIRISKQLLH